MLKKILLALAAILIIIQFFRPDRNDSNDTTFALANNYTVPQDVHILLQGACNDCHSNQTEYPWYSKVQPVAWWLDSHVNDGKRHLNFSAFTNRNIAYQNHKFEEIIEMLKEKEMPLPSYTWFGLHPEANLTEHEADLISGWASAQMDTLKKNYPPDSLILRRRGS
jgi:hypothetical protein